MQVVCDFCEEHLEANKAAFADPRLQLVVDDARAQLENWPGTFDVIIGDLADPVYGGPCYQVSPLGCGADTGTLCMRNGNRASGGTQHVLGVMQFIIPVRLQELVNIDLFYMLLQL